MLGFKKYGYIVLDVLDNIDEEMVDVDEHMH